MKNWTWSMVGVMMLCGLGLLASSALAQDELPKSLLNVTVAFGAGLNTVGEERNERIIPKSFRVKEGGVVHFMVAGFHQVAVYRSGTVPEDITDPGEDETFINDPDGRRYLGPSPGGEPTDRVESVFFAREGDYLVICNVREHFFEEGMSAIVHVRP